MYLFIVLECFPWVILIYILGILVLGEWEFLSTGDWSNLMWSGSQDQCWLTFVLRSVFRIFSDVLHSACSRTVPSEFWEAFYWASVISFPKLQTQLPLLWRKRDRFALAKVWWPRVKPLSAFSSAQSRFSEDQSVW